MANRITHRSCSSKGVNNQMEVNDWLKQSGGDGKNTTRAQKTDDNSFTMVIYRGLVHFLMSLNSGGTFAHCLCLFFNELEFRIKTTRSSRIIRMSFKMAFFQSFAPHPFFMQVRKRPILRV